MFPNSLKHLCNLMHNSDMLEIQNQLQYSTKINEGKHETW